MTTPPGGGHPAAGLPARLRADIATDQAQRYLNQLARHAAAITATPTGGHLPTDHRQRQVQIDQSGTSCILTVTDLGTCTLTATTDQLTAQVDAANAAAAQEFADLIGADLRRFSSRVPLVIQWTSN